MTGGLSVGGSFGDGRRRGPPTEIKKGKYYEVTLMYVHGCEQGRCFTGCCSLKSRFYDGFSNLLPEREVIHPKPSLLCIMNSRSQHRLVESGYIASQFEDSWTILD